MSDEVPRSVMTALIIASGLSFAALFYLFQKHISGFSLLPYEPRRRVPWGAKVAFFAVSMPLMGIFVYLLGSDQPPDENISTNEYLVTGWGNFTFLVMFVLGVAVWLASFFRANAHDLGLPTSWEQLVQDISIGIFATVAAFLPIYAVQFTLLYALQSKTPHPLVKQLEENPSPAMLMLGFAMAVIAAPLFEEFTFRGLLQGWLERREDEVLVFVDTERKSVCLAGGIEIVGEGEEEGKGEGGPRRDVARRLFDDDLEVNDVRGYRGASGPTNAELINITRPTRGWIPDLPHGWTPVLISGVVFGLAHLGHGVAPVSLILFGIVLGYLYQRTHRLVPSITAHMLFNAYSMLLLWLHLQETPP